MHERPAASKTVGAVPALSAAAARQMDVIAVVEPFLAEIDLSDPTWHDLKAVLASLKPAPGSPG